MIGVSLSPAHFGSATAPAASMPRDRATLPVHCVAFLWAFAAMSTRLEDLYLPYADFFWGGILLLCIVRHWNGDLLVRTLLLLLAILLGSLDGEYAINALVWVAKLTLILAVPAALSKLPGLSRSIFVALSAILFGNALLVALDLVGIHAAAGIISAEGRRSTFLTHPGTLWHTAMPVVMYYLYLACADRIQRGWALIALAACALVVWRDGARTGFLVVAMAPVALTAVLALEGKLRALWPLACCGLLVLVCLTQGVEFDESNPLSRASKLFGSYDNSPEMLETVDSVRFELLEHAVDLIENKPVLGNGFWAAALPNQKNESGLMVVHNAYLQVWADFGLLGMLSFVAIVLGWLVYLPRWLRRIARLPSARDRAYYYNACFLIGSYAFMYLVHPISTDWSDWILFVVPYAALKALSASQPATRPAMPALTRGAV